MAILIVTRLPFQQRKHSGSHVFISVTLTCPIGNVVIEGTCTPCEEGTYAGANELHCSSCGNNTNTGGNQASYSIFQCGKYLFDIKAL